MLAAQVLPDHAPLRILIVSDEVNPHGLPAEQLTQPGEISAALAVLPMLNLADSTEALLELPTDQLDAATTRLLRAGSDPLSYDVLVYFAHRIPSGVNGALQQTEFVAAVQHFLAQGGGVVSFHHGIYQLPGKESMQALLGAAATGNVSWNTVSGQRVINVAPGHFITTNGIGYAGQTSYGDPAAGVPSGNYPWFANIPDERYPTLALQPGSGRLQMLFASDYAEGDGTHVLGYTYRQNAWAGQVVMYQPGEYQPQALGPGNNLQVLLNAIVFSHDRVFAQAFETIDCRFSRHLAYCWGKRPF
ncbi:MAG: hypothetical protein IPK97_12520 [Ahniella sp.]|nr:hypothetical protein [Ahniella sp.]